MRSSDLLSIYTLLELLKVGIRSDVCRWHCIATFWGQWKSSLLGGLSIRDWFFIILTIVGFTHVILAAGKHLQAFSVLEPQSQLLRMKNVRTTNLSEVLAGMECCEARVLLSKRYHQCMAGTSSSLPPPRPWLPSVTTTVFAAGVDLQKVFVGASRAKQHIYLMT